MPSPVMSSELTEGDQSTILESSAVGDCSTTVQWEPSMEDPTILQDSNMEPPIASRTRSHDGSMVSTTSFMLGVLAKELKDEVELEKLEKQHRDTGPFTIVSKDGSYSMTSENLGAIDEGLNISKYQTGYDTDIEQSKTLLKCLEDLEIAKNILDGILYNEETDKNIQAYREMNSTRNKKTNEIELPERFKEENTDAEYVLGITFIRRSAEISMSLDSTIKALRMCWRLTCRNFPWKSWKN